VHNTIGETPHHLGLPQSILPLTQAHTQASVSHVLYDIAQSRRLVSVSLILPCHGGNCLVPSMKSFSLEVIFPS
jgi:hypothetical protein